MASIEDTVQIMGNKVTEKVDAVQGKLLEVEKHTLWRIKDCEDLLKSRINDTYVDDSMKKLEEKLKIEVFVWEYKVIENEIDE